MRWPRLGGFRTFFVSGYMIAGCWPGATASLPSKVETNASPSTAHTPSDAAAELKYRRDWNRKTLVIAYDSVGRKNPKWDKLAREALEEMARLRTQVENIESSRKVIGDRSRQAIEAGCDDPLIEYLYVRYDLGSRSGATVSTPKYAAALTQAALRLDASEYPEIRKVYGAIRAAEYVHAIATTNTSRESFPFRRMAMTHAVRVVQEKSAPIKEIDEMVFEIMNLAANNPTQLQDFYKSIEKPLFDNWAQEFQPWLIKGHFYIKYAWQGRGIELAYKVTEEGWQLFRERLKEADDALEQAWTLNPADARIPTEMLTVELGQGKGRKRLELWFNRAMALDTNNYDACNTKLVYLEPKWHGSAEDMLAFGHECVASTNWGGRVPLILVNTHDTLALYAKKGKRTDYWKQPDVWADIKSAFEKFFKLNPAEIGWRHNYARYAYWCEQWDDLNTQIALLGSIDYDYFGGKAEFEKMVALAKGHSQKASKE